MAKYVINQSSKNGTIITNVGDHQEITITQVSTGRAGRQAPPPVPPVPAVAPGSDEDIISTVGKNAKVFINGKRVQ